MFPNFPEAALFFRGFLIGLAIAAPVGPIGILCIRRTLVEGRLAGLVSGLGAASADAVYAAIAAFGLTTVSDVLAGRFSQIRLVGALFLIYLGVRTVLAKVPQAALEQAVTRGLPSAYLTTFLLTVTNPLTILSFLAVFAGLGVGQFQSAVGRPFVLVGGVLAGSSAWWLALSTIVAMVRTRLRDDSMLAINRVAGLAIAAFGVAILASVEL